MRELLLSCSYFGVFLCMALFFFGSWLHTKWKSILTMPMIIAMGGGIAVLLLLNIDYATFQASTQPLNYLLTPATVSLSIPLYRQLEKLKKNYVAILVGIFAGVVASAVSVLAMSAAFGLSHTDYVTLLPKGVTMAIGLSVSEELGGIVPVTVASIVVSGTFGNALAPLLCRLLRIYDPIARGIAIGTCSHAMGTVKANEMGEVEGAMSGLSIAVAGLMTVVVVQVFAQFL